MGCNAEEPKTKAEPPQPKKSMTAKDILGNPAYPAISFGGYRTDTRDNQPTVGELIEDMKILAAMNIKVLRTYHTKMPHATNVVKAIHEIKKGDPDFEMYVMVGAWIDCKGAWTDTRDHDDEEAEANAAEVQRAIDLATTYPDIVKVIAVGNEAMVKWADTYFVQANVILKYVNQLQALKKEGKLPADLWITCSDNFASWGGGGDEYHTEDLAKLIKAVDYVSLHTYPMHDTHYNSGFWGVEENEKDLSDTAQIKAAMIRARDYAISQYTNTATYIKGIAPNKPIHIGETGWASVSDAFYSPEGSKACDEYKEALYYHLIREWTDANGIACFYFEAFDEPWKGGESLGDSEKHFGIFDVDGKAKYAIWDLVDQGIFEGLTRGGNPIVKTYDGNFDAMMKDVHLPPTKK
ncbi:MAG: glycosyl hydrolase family 17 protein [Bacteroidia bacterium]